MVQIPPTKTMLWIKEGEFVVILENNKNNR